MRPMIESAAHRIAHSKRELLTGPEKDLPQQFPFQNLLLHSSMYGLQLANHRLPTLEIPHHCDQKDQSAVSPCLRLQIVALGPAHPETLTVRHRGAVETREICTRDISGRHPADGPVYTGDKCLLIPPSPKLSDMSCCLPKEFRNLLSQQMN